MPSLLFEVATEEIPARYLATLKEHLEEKLAAAAIEISQWQQQTNDNLALKVLTSPRRIAAIWENLPENLPAKEEVISGPPRKVAQDESGNWTKQAIGFCKSKDVSLEHAFFAEKKGGEFLFIKKMSQAHSILSLLYKHFKNNLFNFPFEKSMRWGNCEAGMFIRPVRSLCFVSDLPETTMPPPLFNLQWSNKIYGNPQLNKEGITIHSVSEYLPTLKEMSVYLNADNRKKHLCDTIATTIKSKNLSYDADHKLFEELIHLVESPTPILVEFEGDFLKLPEEVLESEMVHHPLAILEMGPETRN